LEISLPINPALHAVVEPFLIDPSQGWSGAVESWQPLVCVDLERCDDSLCFEALPPVPVIGLGDRDHPSAGLLDAIIEHPIDGATLIQQVQHSPRTAAVIVQLLRSLEGLAFDRALMLESFCYGLLQGSEEYAKWLASRVPSEPDDRPGRVIVERHQAELRIVLDRPHARNAINREIRDQLFEAFTLAALDPEIRSVKLRSMGEVFSAGGDLEEFGSTRDPATAHLIRCRTLPALALARRPEIVDVHVQGACIGAGIEIAAFAARVTAAPTAWFQLPELAMGLLPGAGGCVSVSRRVGRQRAALMILSGQRIDADTALRWGLIDAIETQ
jgi:enoyl-CoA hydratase